MHRRVYVAIPQSSTFQKHDNDNDNAIYAEGQALRISQAVYRHHHHYHHRDTPIAAGGAKK